jgi:hypothetical protein
LISSALSDHLQAFPPWSAAKRIVVPQVAIAVGSTIYGGRAPTIVAALIIGALGGFLSFKGYVRRA